MHRLQHQGWSSNKLNELGFVGRGKSRHRPRNDATLYGGSYPFIQTGDVKAADLYLSEFTQTYNEKGLAQSKLWKPETLCITIAANIAETAILKIKACFPDSIVGFVADPEKSDVRFIKYYIDTIKLSVQNISRGTTQDNLSVDKLLLFDFMVPPLETQRKIAAILSAYDDLIENNTRRIKILEKMARMVYHEWFVNFRFPRFEQVKMLDSPLGMIPEGWEVKTFGEVFTIRYGKNLPTSKIRDLGEYPVYGAGGVIGFYDQMVAEKKVALITCRGNGSGTVWRTREPAFITNNSFHVLPKSNWNYWKYFFVMLTSEHSNVKGAISGSAQPQITIESLSMIDVLVPCKEVVAKFCQIVRSHYAQVDKLYKKNQNLRQTRDLLLPKLISGEVAV